MDKAVLAAAFGFIIGMIFGGYITGHYLIDAAERAFYIVLAREESTKGGE